MAEKKRNQKERILSYIERFGSITALDAVADLGILKLRTRVSELRRDGYPIIGKRETSKNRFGDTVSFNRYSIETDGNGNHEPKEI